MAQITLQNPQALLALPLLWLLLVVFAWRRRFRPFGPFLLRLVIIVLGILALSRPALISSEVSEAEKQRVVALVDQSASLTEGQRQAFQVELARLAQQFPDLTVLYFADRPVLRVDPDPVSAASAPALNPELSNLAEALAMGVKILNRQPGRLFLLSDGLPTAGNTDEVLAEITRQQIPVDVFIVNESGRELPPDIQLVHLSAPPILRQGETFNLDVTLHSAVPTQADLALTQDTVMLAESVVSLEPGLNRFSFDANAESTGLHTFRASVRIDNEVRLQNNSYSAFTQVYPPPKILVVGDEPVPVSRFLKQLENAGFVAERVRAGELPDRLSDLEPYAGMALLDVSARELRLEQMLAVQEFVRSLGRGLLVTGGRNSFSLGGYEDTPLADLLPLSLEPPPREERPPVALLLIIDHSGSMGERRFPATKLAMAKEAAIRATDILGPDDLIGVLIFDNKFEWTVPFQAVRDGAALLKIQGDIASIPVGGGTRILQALEIGLPSLAEQDTFSGPRHAVLLSDGKSFDGGRGREEYDLVADAAVEAGITLSTIAIGEDADQDLLIRLAEQGLGRYHFAGLPDELPALTIAESDILRSSAVPEGEYRPAVFAPPPVLRGLSTAADNCSDAACLQETERLQIPNLSGYIGLTPKPRAEIALQAGPGDPLLAVWGYGLGRVAAWSSDTGSEWANDWYEWQGAARFWGQIIGYTLPAPNLGLLQLDVELEPDGVATLIAEGLTATGQTVDLAATQATLTTPAGRDVPITLRQVSPGRYQQRLRLPDPGAYKLSVIQSRTGEMDEAAAIGFVVPYPAEYALSTSGEDVGQSLLKKIAEMTGGQAFVVSADQQVTDCTQDCENGNSSSADANSSLQPPQPIVELWPWLMQAALILWPIEIAWRRWRRLRIQ